MSAPTIYVSLSQFCETNAAPRRALQAAGFEVRENSWKRRIRVEEMYDALQDVDGVLAAVEPYTADLFARLPRLRCISRCGAGVDAIDLAAARERGITVLATTEAVVQPVAEMTVGMILALARNFSQHVADFSAGQWTKHTGHLLSEWTIGVVGYGRIGRRVAECLRPFGVHLLVHDPCVSLGEMGEGIRSCAFEELLQTADVITVHVSRPPTDGPLLRAREFAMMKRGVRVVNTARGYLLEEDALATALDNGTVAAAALDVFAEEPYAGPLAHHPRVLCTPHVATLTERSRIDMELTAATNLVRFFSGERGA